MSDTGRWVTLQNGVRVFLDEGESVKDHFNKSKEDIKKLNSLEVNIAKVNPNYAHDESSRHSAGYNNNCVHCAMAFEENMKGNDVTANPWIWGKIGQNEMMGRDFYKAYGYKIGDGSWDMMSVGSPKRERVVNELNTIMKEYGNGSRGIIQVRGKLKGYVAGEPTNSHHTMNIINDNGKVLIVDSQNNTYGSVDKMLKGLPTQDVTFIRTDNRQITPEYAKEAFTDRKK